MLSPLSRRFSCPVELALELLGGKWKAVILAHLKEQPRSYAELRKLTPRLSDKMLTQRLRELQDLGLISHVSARSPYRLSARGRKLIPVLDQLYALGSAVAAEVGATFAAP